MTALPILIAPDRRLKTKCEPVAAVDDAVRQKLEVMLETMYDAPGIGLAAPQVGDTRRLIVIDVARDGEEPRPLRIVNPDITWMSDETCVMSEGCLSVPDIYYEVTRPERIVAAYLDENGAPQELEADGLLARCIQHEVDHLNGVLFIDHVSMLKRNMALSKMRKLKAAQAGKRHAKA